MARDGWTKFRDGFIPWIGVMHAGDVQLFVWMMMNRNRVREPVDIVEHSLTEMARALRTSPGAIRRRLQRLQLGRWVSRVDTGWLILNPKGEQAQDHSLYPFPPQAVETDGTVRVKTGKGITVIRVDQPDPDHGDPKTDQCDPIADHGDPVIGSERSSLINIQETVGEGETEGEAEAELPLVKAKIKPLPAKISETKNRFYFVAYWVEANATRGFDLRVEGFKGLERFVLESAADVGLSVDKGSDIEYLAKMTHLARRKFCAEYAKRGKSGKTRGQGIGPQRLTEEFASWMQKDLIDEAKRQGRKPTVDTRLAADKINESDRDRREWARRFDEQRADRRKLSD